MRTISHRVIDLITTDRDKKYELAARMADAIIDISLKQGDCMPRDLSNEGFVQQDITAHWHFANALAEVELRQMERKVFSFPQSEVRYA